MARTQPIQAVEMVRGIRDQLARETANLSAQELVEFYQGAGKAPPIPAPKPAGPRTKKGTATRPCTRKSTRTLA